jgi:uroporphyrinogen III methyltransferase/synthase
LYDHLVSPRLLEACLPRAARVYVGKEADGPSVRQEVITSRLIREAKAGRTVVRLKGGDPFLFGRGGEEALALAKAGVPFEVVPGVTSAVAVPAYAGIPVTHRGLSSSVAIITGHEDPAKPSRALEWERLARSCDTLVCLMGVEQLPRIVAQLLRHGRAPQTPCAVIEQGTHPSQRTVTGTLRAIAPAAARAKVRPPAVLVVGEVVSLRTRLAWYERRPLWGMRILVTRAAEKAEALGGRLEALGAQVERLPAIALAPAASNGALRDLLQQDEKPEWVLFTSPEGIGHFIRQIRPHHRDVRWLAGCRIGAIGPKTREAVERLGLRVDFAPTRFSQEGMAAEFPRRGMRGKRALLLCAEESREVLADGLRQRGMRVTRLPIYRTLVPRALRRGVAELARRRVDLVTVTSAGCADHLHRALVAGGYSGVFRLLSFASIGPVTSSRVRELGGRVVVEAKASTIEGLIDAILRGSSFVNRESLNARRSTIHET